MNYFQKKKLEAYQKGLGTLTVDEALRLAIEAEETTKVLGAFDPATEHFIKCRLGL